MVESVTFTSGATRCVGYLRRSTRQPGPCVVMCTGFGGTQDTPAFLATARDFAAAGFHAMTFDYRTFGESGGQPRQVVSIAGQLDDISAAVSHARTLPLIDPDRMVLWGTSLGGGHVVTVAARDPLIAAVIAQIPFNGFPRKVEGRSTAATLRLLAAMVSDWLRGKLHLGPRYIPAVGPRGDLAVMTGEDAKAVVAGLTTATWRNEVAPRALLEMMRYRPSDFASRVSCPLLVCLGDKDIETTADSAAALAGSALCGEVLRYPITHFDFYREEFRRRVTADQIQFLRKVPALLQ